MAIIRPFGGKTPAVHATAFLAEDAVVVGDVQVGEGSSVWFGCVLRGDVNSIRIGARTNIQDLSVVHVTSKTHPTVIGDEVTVGHRVVLHGCTVKDRCLVGIGSVVLDGAVEHGEREAPRIDADEREAVARAGAHDVVVALRQPDPARGLEGRTLPWMGLPTRATGERDAAGYAACRRGSAAGDRPAASSAA